MAVQPHLRSRWDSVCMVLVHMASSIHTLMRCWLSPLFFTKADQVHWGHRVSQLGIRMEPVVREGPRNCGLGLWCPMSLG